MPISYLGFNLFNDSLISIFWISLAPKNNRPIPIFCMTGLQKIFYLGMQMSKKKYVYTYLLILILTDDA